MRVGVFIKVRMKSKRLPRKALLKIKGRATIEHLIDRAKQSKMADVIVLCTSTNPGNKILEKIAKKNNIECFRGSEDDVLNRFLGAAKKYNLDFFVNIDGDDILVAYEFIDKIIEIYKKTNADYIIYKELPLGATPFGMKVEAVEKVCQIKDESDTEVWGGYFTDSGIFKVKNIEAEKELRRPDIRMTLDYQEDFDFFKEVFNRLYKPGKVFSLREILNLLKKHPEIININRGVQEKYLEYLKKSTKIKFKK